VVEIDHGTTGTQTSNNTATNRHAHATVLTPHARCCTRPSRSDRCRVIWPPAPTHRLRCYILHYCAAGPSGCATPVSRPDHARETESCNSLVATPPISLLSHQCPWVSACTCKCRTLKQGRSRCRQDRLYTQHVYLAVRVIGLRSYEPTSFFTHAYSSHDLAAISRNPLPSVICISQALPVNGNPFCAFHDRRRGQRQPRDVISLLKPQA
jgi:hypothetical protein